MGKIKFKKVITSAGNPIHLIDLFPLSCNVLTDSVEMKSVKLSEKSTELLQGQLSLELLK